MLRLVGLVRGGLAWPGSMRWVTSPALEASEDYYEPFAYLEGAQKDKVVFHSRLTRGRLFANFHARLRGAQDGGVCLINYVVELGGGDDLTFTNTVLLNWTTSSSMYHVRQNFDRNLC